MGAGHLENDYGVDLGKVRWVTFEDGHVAEYREPDGVERASGDKNLPSVRDGELDAAIYGADLPKDPALTSLIPDPEGAARTWYARHKVVDRPHGGGEGATRKVRPASGHGNLPAATPSKGRRGPAQAWRNRLSTVWFECLPGGALQTIINYALCGCNSFREN